MDHSPDNSNLKKRLSTYRTRGGRLKNVSNDLLIDILSAWESWPGTNSRFHSSIGSTYPQMATLIHKAKGLKQSGMITESEFKEVKIKSPPLNNSITMRWDKGRIIRFPDVDHLVDFLRKVA